MNSSFISSIVCRKCRGYLNVIKCKACGEEHCEYCHSHTCNAYNCIDSLCEDFEKLSNEFDELEELKKFIDYEFIDVNILKKAVERYQRYLDNIKVWEIRDTSCLYIRDGILLFINKMKKNIYDESLANLMKSVDIEILSLLNQY
jgi:hypothetical protein